jgi:hypothetical protein
MAAQIVLYRSDRLGDADKQGLERQFAEQSRAELRRLLGCASAEQLQSSSSAASVAGSRRVAELLWAASFGKLVERRLRAAEGSERSSQLLSLACTIPSSAMRATVLQLMEQYGEEGPRRLEPFAASEDSLPEPGLLLLVKQMPRKDVAPSANGGGGEGGGASRLPAAKAAKLATARQAKDRQDRVAQQWMTFSEKLVQVICRQFREAAFRHADAEDAPADLPIKLPANTSVAASHHVEWPRGLPAALAELRLPPLRVYYVRIERKARPDKVLAYFRRQLPSAAQHLNDHGVWLDDFNLDRRSGDLRSVDVFISKPNKDVGILLNQEQQIIVELLIVAALSQADN